MAFLKLLPTYVGVILTNDHLGGCRSVPHECGGDPIPLLNSEYLTLLFPTGVGVIRCLTQRAWQSFSVPHGCGGDPSNQLAYNFAVLHKRGGKSN